MQYFDESELEKTKKQRKIMLIALYVFLAIYVGFTVAMILWYTTLPYKSPMITTVKWIHYPINALFVIALFIYIGIPLKRVNRYYKVVKNITSGIKETWRGTFIEYKNDVQVKDGVDFKSLIFLEWNKYKDDYFERKVLVFNEKPFPEIPENTYLEYITQSNVLVSFRIIDDEDNEELFTNDDDKMMVHTGKKAPEKVLNAKLKEKELKKEIYNQNKKDKEQ